MGQRRVVITGLGAVSPLGNTVKDSWENLINGKSGIAKISGFDASTYTSQVAGEIKDYDYKKFVTEKGFGKLRKLDKFAQYAVGASKEAMEMSGLDVSKNPLGTGVIIGSGIGGINIQHNNSKILVEKGHKRISPFYIPGEIGNITSGFVSIEYGAMGPNMAVQTACASANHSIGTSFMIIQAGMADAMITGGAESTVMPLGVAGFCNMKALSTKYNETPEKASRPFDKGRDGFVIAEGAGILVLEEYEHAKARGADIICEVLGVGMTGDAYDLVMPHKDGEGAFQAMKMATKIGGINPSDINYINTHGTSTPLGDLGECKAIYKLVGDEQSNLNVGSSKSMTGHLLGATSGVEAIFSAMSIKNNIIPTNINIDELDPEIKLTCINTETIEKEVNVALSNSFGFGGHNSALLLKKI